MKIGIDAHLVGVRHGGNEHHFENILQALGRMDTGGDEYFVFNYRNAGAGAIPGNMRLVPLRRGSVYLQRGIEIPIQARRLGLDLLHVPFNFLPVGRARKVVTIHDLAFLHVGDTFDYMERKRMALLTGLSARRADHIFAVSEHAKADIMAEYRIGADRITVTHNAVDREVFRPWTDERKSDFLKEKGIDHPFILFVGTLQPRKNVSRLVEAFRRMASGAGKPLHLVLIGRKGWIYKDIFRVIRENGLEDRVHHLERVDTPDLVGFYNTAQGLVFPSLFEGFGMPILEAMSCGCPVASANVTSMPEIYGDSALPFDPLSVDDIAHAMTRLAENPSLRQDLAVRGLKNCDRFSWDLTAQVIRKAYHSL